MLWVKSGQNINLTNVNIVLKPGIYAPLANPLYVVYIFLKMYVNFKNDFSSKKILLKLQYAYLAEVFNKNKPKSNQVRGIFTRISICAIQENAFHGFVWCTLKTRSNLYKEFFFSEIL
jgi:hypothetical protein